MLQSHNHVLQGHDVLYTPTKYFKRMRTQSMCLMDVKSFTLRPGHGYISSLRFDIDKPCAVFFYLFFHFLLISTYHSKLFPSNAHLIFFSHSLGYSYLFVFWSHHFPSNSYKSLCSHNKCRFSMSYHPCFHRIYMHYICVYYLAVGSIDKFASIPHS